MNYFTNFTLGVLLKVNLVKTFTNFTLSNVRFSHTCEYFTNLIPAVAHGILYTDEGREWLKMRNEKTVYIEMLGWSEREANNVIALLNWVEILEIPLDVLSRDIADNGDDLKKYMSWMRGGYRFIRERLYTVLTEDLGDFLHDHSELDTDSVTFDDDMEKLYNDMKKEIKHGLVNFGQWIGMSETKIFGECLQIVTAGE